MTFDLWCTAGHFRVKTIYTGKNYKIKLYMYTHIRLKDGCVVDFVLCFG